MAVLEATVGEVRLLLCDGGLTRSARLMQTQADVSGRRVGRSAEQDLSCLGAADAGEHDQQAQCCPRVAQNRLDVCPHRFAPFHLRT